MDKKNNDTDNNEKKDEGDVKMTLQKTDMFKERKCTPTKQAMFLKL